MCLGACRFKQVAQIVENDQRNGYSPNSNVWFKNTHEITDEKWREIFMALSENRDIKPLVDLIAMDHPLNH